MISKRTKYAIKALVALAKNKDKKSMTIMEIAQQENIPKKFLEAILLDMRKQGILSSKIGIGGGYYMLKQPGEIVLTQLMRTIDGPIAMLPCVSLNFYERCEDCTDEVTCGIRDAFAQVRDASLKVMSETTLEDIVKREERLKVSKSKGKKQG
jgi:Rrf2 family protein